MKLKYKVKQPTYDSDYKDWKAGDTIVFRGLVFADESDRPGLKQYGIQHGFTTQIHSIQHSKVIKEGPRAYILHYSHDKMGVHPCCFERKRFL